MSRQALSRKSLALFKPLRELAGTCHIRPTVEQVVVKDHLGNTVIARSENAVTVLVPILPQPEIDLGLERRLASVRVRLSRTYVLDRCSNRRILRLAKTLQFVGLSGNILEHASRR